MHRQQVLQPRPRLPSRLLLFFSQGPLSQVHVFLAEYENTLWKVNRMLSFASKNGEDSKDRRLLAKTIWFFSIQKFSHAFSKKNYKICFIFSGKPCWSVLGSLIILCYEKWCGNTQAIRSEQFEAIWYKQKFLNSFVQYNFTLTILRKASKHHVDV